MCGSLEKLLIPTRIYIHTHTHRNTYESEARVRDMVVLVVVGMFMMGIKIILYYFTLFVCSFFVGVFIFVCFFHCGRFSWSL